MCSFHQSPVRKFWGKGKIKTAVKKIKVLNLVLLFEKIYSGKKRNKYNK